MWLPHAPAEEFAVDQIRKIIDINLLGTIFGSRVAVRQMKQQGSGCIVNILSTSALEGRAGSTIYGASKYGATGFTKGLRLEVKPNNIFVCAVYPGGMKTHLFDEKQPVNYEDYMDPGEVANKVITNLEQDEPEEELVIKRPK